MSMTASTTASTTVAAGSGSFSGWRLMFCLAGIFTIAAAIPLWIAPAALSKLFGFEPVPVDILYTGLFAVLVIAFAIGYWRTGADPAGNRPIVETAILGKLLVMLVGYQHFVTGTTNLPFAALVTVDLVCAAFFWRYLYSHPERSGLAQQAA